MNVVDVPVFLWGHTMLHVGRNLALMGHLNMPRFDWLVEYRGP